MTVALYSKHCTTETTSPSSMPSSLKPAPALLLLGLLFSSSGKHYISSFLSYTIVLSVIMNAELPTEQRAPIFST